MTRIHSNSARDTEEAGAWLASQTVPGDRICLSGRLGAGKTTLIRGFIRAFGYQGAVRSPSFTLMNIYPTTPRLIHVDLFRVFDPSELTAMSLDEESEQGILLVEWGERFIEEWGPASWKIVLKMQPEATSRLIIISRTAQENS